MMPSGAGRLPAFTTWRLTLGLVVLAALAVRLFGLTWDEGADLHPDELFIAKIVLIDRIHFEWPPNLPTLLDPAVSGLNPRSVDPATGQFREFAYGALPLLVTDAIAWVLSLISGKNWNAMDHAYLVGRVLSALLSALTIVPIAMVGRLAGGEKVGLLAALFAALAPMSIQLAHFFTTDSWLTFFVAWTLLASVSAANHGDARGFAVAGGAFGLAMACKGSVFTLCVPIVVAVAYNAANHWGLEPRLQLFRHAARNLTAAALATVAMFAIFEPFALLRPDVYITSLATQADIVSGRFDVPFTRIYAGTTPLLYQLDQLVRWGYGPAAGLLALAGLGLLTRSAVRGESAVSLVLVSWVIPYSAVLVVADVKFLRYLEPITPVLAVGAGLALVRLSDALTTRQRRMGAAVTAALLLLALGWTAAFMSIYAHENPRVAATKWIYSSVAPGSNLTAEYWDDALPRSLAYAFTPTAFGYGSVVLDLYRDMPSSEASDAIYESLAGVDFILQSSQRVETAMRSAPWRYPVQARFLEGLDNGRLGFDLVRQFERAPELPGLRIDDRRADESFINYDHPSVSIFQRTEALSRDAYDDFMSWALDRPSSPLRAPPEPTLLLDTPVGENPSVNDARWSAGISGQSLGAVALWVVLLAALLAAGLPVARAVFSQFPEMGWGLARILALVIAAYVVWLGASLHLFRFRAAWAIVSILALMAIGWFLVSQGIITKRTAGRTQDVWIHAEAAFWLVFVLFLAFRLVVPDGWHPFWGGEKPMELALINAIGRSAYFPPYDPWFADGYVNYYYYGFYLIAFLGKATGIPLELAFNLALPTMMALIASGGFSVGAALAYALTKRPRYALIGGWFATAALVLIGNLTTAQRLVEGVPERFDPFVVWVWNGSRAIENAITEFPFFTGLYADLHSHVVALPMTILVIALSWSLVSDSSVALRPDRTPTASAKYVTPLRFALLALTLGSLSATNAWDVPVYAALAIVCALMAGARGRLDRGRIGRLILAPVVIGLGAWLLFLPFHQHFVALFTRVALVEDPTDLIQFLSHVGALVAGCAFGMTARLLPPSRAARNSYVAPAAAIACALAGLLIIAVARDGFLDQFGIALVCVALAGPPLLAAWVRVMSGRLTPSWLRRLSQLILVSGAIALTAGVLSGRPVLGLALGLALAATVGWLLLVRPAERFVFLLLVAAFFVVAGVEIVVVADDLIDTVAYRMNTIFKFYNQVWVLLAIAFAVLVAAMARDVVASRSPEVVPTSTTKLRIAWSRAGLGLASVLVAASLTYPVLAIGPRLEQRFEPGTPSGSLNAFAWMEQGTVPVSGSLDFDRLRFRGDAEAIAWLLQNVDGTPVVAEASIGPYRCNGSRISSATGLPTIIGWERHQQQQRFPEDLPQRVRDVRTLYTSPNVAEKTEILNRYNVEFVVVGDLERAYPVANNECTPDGSAAGIAAFDTMIGQNLEVAFTGDGTTIYRVVHPGSNS